MFSLLRMPPPQDVPDGTWLRLRWSRAGQLLQHQGTGEEIKLEGRWCIQVLEGNAFVVQLDKAEGEGQSEWAANLMDQRLLMASRAPHLDPEMLIFNEKDGCSRWRKVEFDSGNRSSIVRLTLESSQAALLQVFVSTLPRDGLFVRWGLQRVVSHLRGNSHDGRWVAKAAEGFRGFFEKMYYSKDHLRSSRRSLVWSEEKKQRKPDSEKLSDFDEDFTCSTEGLVLLCAYAVTSGKLAAAPGVNSKERGLAILQGLVTYFVDPGTARIPVTDEDESLLGFVVMRNGGVSLPKTGDWEVSKKLGMVLKGCIGFSEAIVSCASIIRRASQHKPEKVQAAVLVLHCLTDFLAATVEEQRLGSKFLSVDHLDAGDIYRTGSNRPRRVSKTFKWQVSKQVAGQPSLRNAQQFLSARRMLLGGLRKGSSQKKAVLPVQGLRAATGRQFCQENMLAYISSCRRTLGQCKHGYIGMDATRVSGKDLMYYVFEAVEARKACWLVPKAPCPMKALLPPFLAQDC